MKNVINAPANAKYLADFLTTLPNGILNKRECGCGATHLILTNSEPYIVAVPNVELIQNKCSQLPEVLGVYAGVTESDIVKYIIECQTVPKIMVTYDSLPKVIRALRSLEVNLKSFNLAIDEYHQLLSAYSYRDNAINGLFDLLLTANADGTYTQNDEFAKVTYISATPIDPDYTPKQLSGLPITEVKWQNTIRIRPHRIATNKPFTMVKNLISNHRKAGYLTRFGETASSHCKELYFFLNSVTVIKDIIDELNLREDEVKVICSETAANLRVLGDTKISKALDPNKPITFITAKAFAGSDFYSDSGMSFIISSVSKKHTLIDIASDIYQIAGRIRTETNPFKYNLIHIYNTKTPDLTAEELEQYFKDAKYLSETEIMTFNRCSLEQRRALLQRFQLDLENSYTRYNPSTELFEYDELKERSDRFQKKLIHHIYTRGLEKVFRADGTTIEVSKIQAEYAKSGLYATVKSSFVLIEDKELRGKMSATFQDRVLLFLANELSGGDTTEMRRSEPIIAQIYDRLGSGVFSTYKYKESTLKELLYAASDSAYYAAREMLYKLFTIGHFYTSADIKTQLDKVYKELKMITKPKASDIEEYFVCEQKTMRIDGKVKIGYHLTSHRQYRKTKNGTKVTLCAAALISEE